MLLGVALRAVVGRTAALGLGLWRYVPSAKPERRLVRVGVGVGVRVEVRVGLGLGLGPESGSGSGLANRTLAP